VYQPFANPAARRGAAPAGIHPAGGLVAIPLHGYFEEESTFRLR